MIVDGQFAPNPPIELLTELARISELLSSKGRQRPVVTVYLASGSQIEGRVRSLELESGQPTLVLDAADGSQRAYFALANRIDAVAIQDSSILTGSALSGHVPGRLELLRSIQGILEGTVGPPVPSLADHLDDGARGAISRVLEQVAEAFRQLLEYEDARLALVDLSGIQLAANRGSSVSAAVEHGVLRVEIPVSQYADTSANTIRAHIENAL